MLNDKHKGTWVAAAVGPNRLKRRDPEGEGAQSEQGGSTHCRYTMVTGEESMQQSSKKESKRVTITNVLNEI